MKKNTVEVENNSLVSDQTKKISIGKIFDTVWQVFKGLFIAALILAVIFNTYVSICYLKEQQAPIILEMAYPYNTQDYRNLLEAAKKNPDSAEYKQMLKDFNTKYSISYKVSGTYTELARLHKENPDSEEYKQTLAKLLEEFDISAEDITFDE
ncbi:MAG: hypothetical protein HDT44_04765 [Ruminococcaceae bacterium]|nr:hypothetical protein [Oscillospiraceae bacterium]